VETLKKIALAAHALGLLAFGFTRARLALASPEELIVARLDQMVDGFHSNTLRHVMAGFHHDFRDRSSGSRRGEVANALRYLFFQERDAATKRFAYRVSIPREELVVELDPEEPDRAEVSLRAVFERSRNGEWGPWWDMHARLVFVNDGDSWTILESREVNHSERRDDD
jgi:hypothetical protein